MGLGIGRFLAQRRANKRVSQYEGVIHAQVAAAFQPRPQATDRESRGYINQMADEALWTDTETGDTK